MRVLVRTFQISHEVQTVLFTIQKKNSLKSMGSKDGARRPPSSFRIPLGLQMVFLSSSRGLTVHKPPPDKSGSKEFHRNDSIPNLAKKGPTTTGMTSGSSHHEPKKNVGTMKTSNIMNRKIYR